MPALTECLQTDHRRLDAILAECKALASAGGFAAAADRFATFADGLSRHIDAEEDVLFPRPGRSMRRTRGPRPRDALGARADPRAARPHLAALRASDPPGSHGASPRGRPEAHNMKEERVLYPMADEAAGEAPDADQLQARLTGVLEGRVHPR